MLLGANFELCQHFYEKIRGGKKKSSTSVCLSHKHMVHYTVSLDARELDLLIFKTFKPLVLFQVKCKYFAL